MMETKCDEEERSFIRSNVEKCVQNMLFDIVNMMFFYEQRLQ